MSPPLPGTGPARCCPVCASPAPAPWLRAADPLLGGARRWTVRRCRRCGLGMVDPLPASSELDAAYPADFDPYVRPHRDPRPLGRLARAYCEARLGWPERGGRAPRWLLAAAAPWLALRHRGIPFRGRGRWLDVGCGGGAALHRFRALEPAFEPHGLERDAGAAARARALGFDVRHGRFPESGLPTGCFDVVTLNHVLEHLADPVAALREVRRLLAPGGAALVAVPNRAGCWARLLGARWVALDLPRHLYHFTPASLRRAAGAAGLRIAWSRHEGTQGPWEVWKRALVRRGWLPPGRSLRNAVLRAPIRLATAALDLLGGADQFAACLETVD